MVYADKYDKTVYNIYSNSREVLARDLKLKIENKSLQRDPLPRYLGVALDPRLNLTAHVEQLAGRVRERIGLMKKLAGTNWGATLSSLKTCVCNLRKISPGVRKPHPQPRE
ncbi:hypothetical protein RRG08_042013 [Elysia crispata]|uniref:Uncharacterized protein n=1 Tax=Elysia crispata TaxID=231223 RepID=A0AAE0Z8F2_9GAST|nr:hypothetical protein RRG08_042013 [Elysia crispata]